MNSDRIFEKNLNFKDCVINKFDHDPCYIDVPNCSSNVIKNIISRANDDVRSEKVKFFNDVVFEWFQRTLSRENVTVRGSKMVIKEIAIYVLSYITIPKMKVNDTWLKGFFLTYNINHIITQKVEYGHCEEAKGQLSLKIPDIIQYVKAVRLQEPLTGLETHNINSESSSWLGKEFFNDVVFEWFQRTLSRENVTISGSKMLIKEAAMNVRSYITIPSMQVSDNWLKGFFFTYNINHIITQKVEYGHCEEAKGQLSLKIPEIIRYVKALMLQESQIWLETDNTKSESSSWLGNEFFNDVVFEWFQRTLSRGNVTISGSKMLIKEAAMDVLSYIAIPSMRVSDNWLKRFFLTYNINHIITQKVEYGHCEEAKGQLSLKIPEIIRYVKALMLQESQIRLQTHNSKSDNDNSDVDTYSDMMDDDDVEEEASSTTIYDEDNELTIDSYDDALKHLQPLDNLACLENNSRAIGIISQLREIFKKLK